MNPTRRNVLFASAVVLLLTLGLLFSPDLRPPVATPNLCSVCRRPAHRETKAIGMVDGEQRVFCCPACARSQHSQSGRGVELTSVTDFPSGNSIPAPGAWYVRGSDVNPCLTHDAEHPSSMQPLAREYDRCSPGVIAFRTRPAAASFASRHGGSVVPFQTLFNNAR